MHQLDIISSMSPLDTIKKKIYKLRVKKEQTLKTCAEPGLRHCQSTVPFSLEGAVMLSFTTFLWRVILMCWQRCAQEDSCRSGALSSTGILRMGASVHPCASPCRKEGRGGTSGAVLDANHGFLVFKQGWLNRGRRWDGSDDVWEERLKWQYMAKKGFWREELETVFSCGWCGDSANIPATYLDILVILSAWLLSDSLYALTTTVSAVLPHFSAWRPRSRKEIELGLPQSLKCAVKQSLNPRTQKLLYNIVRMGQKWHWHNQCLYLGLW